MAEPTVVAGGAPLPVPHPYQGRLTGGLLRLYGGHRALAPLGILACFALTTTYVLVNNPTDGKPDFGGGCVLRALTGFDCPGCGGTRAFWYLLHGNVPQAARHHLVFTFAVPFLVYAYVAWSAERVFGVRLPRLRIGPKTITAFLAAWAGFTVVRNLPWAPFTSLYV